LYKRSAVLGFVGLTRRIRCSSKRILLFHWNEYSFSFPHYSLKHGFRSKAVIETVWEELIIWFACDFFNRILQRSLWLSGVSSFVKFSNKVHDTSLNPKLTPEDILKQ
jgi:hypothetical protein